MCEELLFSCATCIAYLVLPLAVKSLFDPNTLHSLDSSQFIFQPEQLEGCKGEFLPGEFQTLSPHILRSVKNTLRWE